MSDTPVIIEAAINGTAPKSRNPNVPRTADEIEADAIASLNAGAAIIHAHNANIRWTGREAADDYLAAWRPILDQRPDALWYPTGVVAPGIDDRLAHTEILAAELGSGLRMAYVDPGSTNVGWIGRSGAPTGYTYTNTFEDIAAFFGQCARLALGPAVAIYEPGWLFTTLHYLHQDRLPAGTMVKLYFTGPYDVMGRGTGPSYGLPPTENALGAYLDMLESSGLPWSVSVWGGDLMATPVARMALERGGHLHVGLEEFYDPGRQPTNVELIAECVDLAAEVGRPIATPTQAAELLGLPSR